MHRVPGILKATPDDFVVEEIPAYEPSGQGTHVFVRFRKRDLPTDGAVRAIAGALGASARDAGIAGMKDKRAITVQTISLAVPRGQTPDDFVRAASVLALPGIEILDVKRHDHKLKAGHLKGNRFTIRVRGVPAARAGELLARFSEIAATGVPNAFGAQRFGVASDNAERARAILEGKEPRPRDRRLMRLLYSALQSAVFNDVLAERVSRGDWTTALAGDVLKKEDTGGLFVCTDEQEDAARAARGEVSATGPMFGPKTMPASGEPAKIEEAALVRHLGPDWAGRFVAELGEGTRRALRLRVAALEARLDSTCNRVASASGEEETSCVVEFVLPKGAFATTVIEQAVAVAVG